MDDHSKLHRTVDALFGGGVSKKLPSGLEFAHSRKTGRIRSVSHDGRLLCTLRPDGGLAVTPYLAQILLKSKKFRENCLEVDAESVPFVEEGRSVFCSHVAWCGKNVRISSDVPVLFEDRVIAVGKAVLSAGMISEMGRGVAVKVRDSLKSRTGADKV